MLGKGAFGAVGLATRRAAGATVAVKAVLKARTPLAELAEEVAVMRRLAPACAQRLTTCLIGFFQSATHWVVVMTYVPRAITLRSLLSDGLHPRIADSVARGIIGSLVDGLLAMHALGVAHRDVKPANVMTDPVSGHCTYIDLGLACVRSACSGSGRIGTDKYWPPEVALRREWNADAFARARATDAWALGLVLFELVTRRGAVDAWEAAGGTLESFARDFDLASLASRPPSASRSLPSAMAALCRAANAHLGRLAEQGAPVASLDGLLARDPRARLSALDAISARRRRR